MLSTIFMICMFVWMLTLVLEFNLGALPLVVVLTTIIALVKLVRRPLFKRNFKGV